MKKYPFIKQDDKMDCGVSSLLMIIKYYKGSCSKEYLRNLTNTTKEGTTAYDMLEAGSKFNFTTFGLKGKLEDLPSNYLPVIAHVRQENFYHFIVIYEINLEKNC